MIRLKLICPECGFEIALIKAIEYNYIRKVTYHCRVCNLRYHKKYEVGSTTEIVNPT